MKALRQMCAAYYGSVSLIDHHVGRLMAWLEQHGLLERTIVIFTSDHGDYNGDRRLDPGKWPAIVRECVAKSAAADPYAGGASAGRTCGALSQHEDLASTILDLLGLDLLGLKLPPLLPGHSLALQSGRRTTLANDATAELFSSIASTISCLELRACAMNASS